MKNKKFDCVEMKNQIQAKILQEFAGLTPKEQKRLTEDRIKSDPILGPVWSRARKNQNASGKKRKK